MVQQSDWTLVDPIKVYRFDNCRVLKGDQLVENDFVLVRNGRILDPLTLFYDERKTFDERIDLGGHILSPGLIDVQINGGYGYDFTNDIIKDKSIVKKVASKLVQSGVTAFCPTIVTASTDKYKTIVENLEIFEGGPDGACCLGAHLEGPFISPIRKGAHDDNFIIKFSEGFKTVTDVYGGDLKKIRIVTLAPELDKSSEVIRCMSKLGITVSIGHTDATYEQAMKAAHDGAKMVTHTYNSMTAFHHRNPGLIGLLGNQEKLVHFGLVADSHHTHDAALRLVLKSQPSALILVTDAISALGLEDGVHDLGSKRVEVHGNRATVAGTQTLSGSVTPLNLCVKTFAKATGCSPGEALAAATCRPAQLLGVDDERGVIKTGARADFVILDDNFNVKSTWIAGQLVYKS